MAKPLQKISASFVVESKMNLLQIKNFIFVVLIMNTKLGVKEKELISCTSDQDTWHPLLFCPHHVSAVNDHVYEEVSSQNGISTFYISLVASH